MNRFITGIRRGLDEQSVVAREDYLARLRAGALDGYCQQPLKQTIDFGLVGKFARGLHGLLDTKRQGLALGSLRRRDLRQSPLGQQLAEFLHEVSDFRRGLPPLVR